MTDDRLGRAAGQRLRDQATPHPNPHASVQQAMAQVRQTGQVRRRWWLPTWRSKTAPSPAIDQTTDYQPTSIPAANGHTPTVTGRTQSMLSPVKAITAGAIVFAIGGAFLIAQPFDQRGNVPGAEVDAEPAAAYFTGEVTSGPAVQGSLDEEDDVFLIRDEMGLADTIETSDPRVSGTLSWVTNLDWHVVSDTEGVLPVTNAWRIENDGGTWSGQGTGLSHQTDGGLTVQTAVLTGEGGYDGLTAFVVFQRTDDEPFAVTGAVFPREMPPFPEAPPAE